MEQESIVLNSTSAEMEIAAQKPVDDEQKIEEKLKMQNAIKSGARWLFWIAGLSFVNSIILHNQGKWSFLAGLGITQVVDVLVRDADSIFKVIGLFFNLLVGGLFIFLGVFAQKRKVWAFLVGVILYALDGLLSLVAMDWFGFAFHAFAAAMIFSGMLKISKLEELEKA